VANAQKITGISVKRVSGRGGLMMADSGDAAVVFGISRIEVVKGCRWQTQLCHQNHFRNSILNVRMEFYFIFL